MEQTWLTRSRGESQGRRITRGANDPWPTSQQISLPADLTVHLEKPGFTLGHVVTDEREAHPLDNQRGAKAKARSLLDRVFAKIGLHGQIFTNFRVDVGVVDTTLIPYNPSRSYLFLVNTGPNAIFLAFDRNADGNTGVPIPAGGFYEPILGTMSSLHAISLVANQQAVIVEGFYSFPGT